MFPCFARAELREAANNGRNHLSAFRLTEGMDASPLVLSDPVHLLTPRYDICGQKNEETRHGG